MGVFDCSHGVKNNPPNLSMNKYYYFYQMLVNETETETAEIASRFLRGEIETETLEMAK